MKLRLLITGSNGQLGSEIKYLSSAFSEYDFLFTSRKELEITNKNEIEKFLNSNNIDVIINCAAYTAVDKAEEEKDLANRTNHLAVKNLSEIAKNRGVGLIHISTDYVFNGEGFRPYPEDHHTNPLNVYGRTKLDGENAMRAINPENSMVIRTSWVYSSFGNNFVKTMLRLGEERKELNVINDQVGAPTYARDLANFILEKAVHFENENVGIYHFSNEGVCSWYDFAREIMEYGKRDCAISPIATSEYPTPAKRPYYSLMDKTQIKKDFDYDIPHWKESLKKCVNRLIA